MKLSNLTFAVVLVSLVVFVSCEKDTQNISLPPNTTIPATSNIANFFNDNLNETTETQTFNSSSSTTNFISNKGISYTFEPNTFVYSNGSAVSGSFTIEFVEALTNKEMLLINKPTFTHDGQLLVSGGVVYLNATQNGQQLSINDNSPVMVSIPTNNYVPMDFFDGSFDNQGGFGWDESEEDTVITNTGDNGQDSTFFNDMFSFDFEIDSMGWINCDYFYNSPDPLTQVEVILPDSFNGENSQVFIFYETINSLAGLSDYDTNGTFDLGVNYSTPVGMDVSFVVISESNDSYYYAIVGATITQDHIETIGSLTEVSEAELELYLNGL